MRRHTRGKVWQEVVLKPNVAGVALIFSVVSTLTWIRDEFMSPATQEKLKIPKLLPHWRWWAWAVIGLSVLLITTVESCYQLIGHHDEECDKELDAGRDSAETEISRLRDALRERERTYTSILSSKPRIERVFLYEGQKAVISVTNNGAAADVWASLRVDGLGVPVGPFSRWAHSTSFKTRIAKGETRDLVLAELKIDVGVLPTATWLVHFAMETAVAAARATYSSLMDRRDDGQAPDVDVYVEIFSEPDSVEPPKACHVILHSRSAEEYLGSKGMQN